MAQIRREFPVPNQNETAYKLGETNSATVWAHSLGRFYWEGNKYDGTVTGYFEVVFEANSTTAYVGMFDETNTEVAASEVSYSGSSANGRVRSGSFVMTSGSAEYHSAIKSGTAGAWVRYFTARLIIIQSGTITKGSTQYEFDGFQAYRITTAIPGTFTYTAADYSDTKTIYFECYGRSGRDGSTSVIQLKDNLGNIMDTWNATSYTWSRHRSTALTLVDGRTYSLYLTGGDAGEDGHDYYNAQVTGVKMVIDQTSLTGTWVAKVQQFFLSGGSLGVFDNAKVSSTTEKTFQVDARADWATYWDDDEWVGTITKKLTSVLKTDSGTGYVLIKTGEENSTTSATFETKSTTTTPADNTEYWLKGKTSSTNTVTIDMAYLDIGYTAPTAPTGQGLVIIWSSGGYK